MQLAILRLLAWDFSCIIKMVVEGGLNDKMTHVVSCVWSFYLVMDSSQTSAWDNDFSFLHPTVRIFQNIVNIFSKEKFNGESEINVLYHLFHFVENVNLVIFVIKVLHAIYSNSLSMVKSRNGSKCLQTIPFTHGNRSWSYFYLHIITMTMKSCVMKLILFRERRMNP